MGGVISTGLVRGSRLAKSVAGAANVTLTADEAQNRVLEFTGALTGSISVGVPDAVATAGAEWLVFNNTTGLFTLTAKTVSGTGIVVAQGRKAILYSDGTNLVTGVAQDEGRSTVNMASDADITLTAAQAAAGIIEITSTVLTATRNVILPTSDGRVWIVHNNTSTTPQSLVFKTSAGTGVTVAAAARRALIYCDGTNIVAAATAI